MTRPIFLTNSKSHAREQFVPLQPGKVKFYSCGPTVYAPIHIGNLRAGLTADLIARFFKYMGYEVTYVRNYTDVDDKIIKRANDENRSCDEVTREFITYVENDYALAQMIEPTHKTLVTTHMPEIISMIQKIIDHGKGYVTRDNEVFFSIPDFAPYGLLSGKKLEDLIAGARVEVNTDKKNPADFSLWKPAKPGEPAWDSPWGKGRPGWHIECSAMACKWLGPQMDIHHGGEDLIFPHHENEIAQSEAATGHAPYVKYWLHNAFLTLSQEKMSKSLGNIVSARDFLSQFGGEVARMIFLGVHYRSVFDFNASAVDQAITGLERIYEAKARAEMLRNKKITHPDTKAEPAWGAFLMDCEQTRSKIRDHYCNDLNTSGALSEVYTLIREFNRVCALPNSENTVSAILGGNELIKVLEEEIGAVIGVGKKQVEAALTHLQSLKQLRHQQEGGAMISDQEIEALIDDRKQARVAKNFKRSDEVRDLLLSRGIEIKDSPTGTTWKRV